MKKILLIAGAGLVLAGCGEKGDFERRSTLKSGRTNTATRWITITPASPSVLPSHGLIRLAQARNSVILDGFIEQGLMVFEQGYDSNVLGITDEGVKAKVWSTTDGACIGRRAVDEIKNGRNRETVIRK